MSKIQEIIIEPTKIKVGSNFLLKVKVEDDYFKRRKIISENNKVLITENEKKIRTEWGI